MRARTTGGLPTAPPSSGRPVSGAPMRSNASAVAMPRLASAASYDASLQGPTDKQEQTSAAASAAAAHRQTQSMLESVKDGLAAAVAGVRTDLSFMQAYHAMVRKGGESGQLSRAIKTCVCLDRLL